MNFDNVDTISLKKDDLTKLLEWRDNNKDLVRNCKNLFDEGVIKFEEYYKQYFKVNNDIAFFQVWIYNGVRNLKVAEIEWNFKSKQVNVLYYSEDYNYPKNEAIQDIITIYASMMAYIENFRAEKVYINERVVKTVKQIKSKKKKNKRSNIVHMRKEIKVRVIPPELDREREKREYNISAESWSVRGHWRMYKKSGRKVWINPHTKGKGNKETKEYKFEI